MSFCCGTLHCPCQTELCYEHFLRVETSELCVKWKSSRLCETPISRYRRAWTKKTSCMNRAKRWDLHKRATYIPTFPQKQLKYGCAVYSPENTVHAFTTCRYRCTGPLFLLKQTLFWFFVCCILPRIKLPEKYISRFPRLFQTWLVGTTPPMSRRWHTHCPRCNLELLDALGFRVPDISSLKLVAASYLKLYL